MFRIFKDPVMAPANRDKDKCAIIVDKALCRYLAFVRSEKALSTVEACVRMLQGECQRSSRLREEIPRTSNTLLLISLPHTIVFPAPPPETTYTLAFCAAPYRPTGSHRSEPYDCVISTGLNVSRIVLTILLPRRVGFLLSSDVL